jgi:hypothetical protein
MPGVPGRGLTAVTGLLGVATTVTTVFGWGRSGQRTRNSYAVVDAVEQAGVLEGSAARAAPLWFLVPALCGLALLALATRRHTIAGLATTTLGALVGTGAILVGRSPLVAQPAVGVAVVVGAATVLSGVAVLVTARKETVG